MKMKLKIESVNEMKNMYYSYLTSEEKQLFKNYCVLKNISSFKMQNYFSGNYPIPKDFKEWLMSSK